MKKLILILIILSVAMSLYAQENIFPKEFKTKKVKLTDNITTVGAVLETLSKDSEIKFLAGDNYDWRVAERDILLVNTHEVSLNDLLGAISICTKLVWVKKNDFTYVLTYDPNTDYFINNLDKRKEENIANKRKKVLDDIYDDSKYDKMDTLRDEDPIGYLLGATGLDTTIKGTIDNIPGLKEAFTNGSKMTIKGSDLNEKAINYINTTNDIIANIIRDRAEKSTNKRNKRNEKRAAEKVRKILPDDMSKVTIEVNNGDNRFGNILLGSATLMVDGRPIGFIPIVDNSNPIIKKVGGALVEMYENPNADPRSLFASLGGFEMFRDMNSNMNKDIYDENKINIPDGIVFDEEIDLGTVPNSKLNAFELLSKASGYEVVSDNYVNLFDIFGAGKIRQKGTLKEIVSDINEAYNLTMYMNGKVLVFYSIKWFEEIQKLMPKAYYEKWGKQYSEEEFLSMDNLFEMSTFTKDQLSFGFMKSSQLTKLTQAVVPNIETIAFINNLSNLSFENINSEKGLLLSALSNVEYERLISIDKFRFLSTKENAVLKLTSQKDENCETIVFSVLADDDKPVNVTIKLDKYTPFNMIGVKIPTNVPKE